MPSETGRSLRSQRGLFFSKQKIQPNSPYVLPISRLVVPLTNPQTRRKKTAGACIRWLSRSHTRGAPDGRLIVALFPSLSFCSVCVVMDRIVSYHHHHHQLLQPTGRNHSQIWQTCTGIAPSERDAITATYVRTLTANKHTSSSSIS